MEVPRGTRDRIRQIRKGRDVVVARAMGSADPAHVLLAGITGTSFDATGAVRQQGGRSWREFKRFTRTQSASGLASVGAVEEHRGRECMENKKWGEGTRRVGITGPAVA